jgi:hypothetical protein
MPCAQEAAGNMPAEAGRMPALPQTKPNWTIFHNKLPPTQLRELDLLVSDRLGGHRPPLHQTDRPALILLFAKKFFRPAFARRMRWTGQIFWLLASSFFPPSPPKIFGDWPNWEVVSSYSSATAPDSHGISCADPLFQARKELVEN